MSKGAYDVNDPYVGPSKDGSFRSCICAMLVFISICGIIIIVTTVLKTSGDKTKTYPNHSNNALGHADAISGNKALKDKNSDIEKTTKKPTQSHQPVTKGPPLKAEHTNETEVIDANADVEAFTPQGVETLTTRRSGQINIATTTTTPKPVLTEPPIPADKTEKPLETRPETITVSQTANLSTPKPDDKLVSENNITATQKTGNEILTPLSNITTTTTQNIKDVTIENRLNPVTNNPQTTQSTHETTTKNIQNTTQIITDKAKHDAVIEDKDKPVTNSPQVAESITQKTMTQNTETTTGNIETETIQPKHNIIENKDKQFTNSSQTEHSKTQETTTQNIKSVTENTETITETIENNPQHNVTENKDKQFTNSSQIEHSKTQETTTQNIKSATENTETITETIENNPQHNVTENKDKQFTNSSQTEHSETQETTTENTESATENTETITKTIENNPQHNLTENKDKKFTNSSQTEQSNSQETTTENIETITETIENNPENNVTEKKDNQLKNSSQTKHSKPQETTTENTESITETIENNPQHNLTENKDKQFTNSSQTEHSNTQETTTENTDSATENTDSATENTETIENKSKHNISENNDKLITNSSQTTTENKNIETTTTISNLLLKGNKKSENIVTTTQPNEGEKTTITKKDTTVIPPSEEENIVTTIKPGEEEIKNKNKDRTTVIPPLKEEKLKNIVTKANEEETTVTPLSNEEDKPTENVFSYETHTTTIQELLTETSTRPSQFKRLTPSPGERTSTIVETEDTAQYTSVESLETPESDPCGEECRQVGARMLSRMNHSGDACEHFYDYACGGDNIDNTPEDNWKRIADGLDRINSRSPNVYKTFKNFYKSCVHFHIDYDYSDRVSQAIDLITSVGNSSVENIGDKSALTELLTQLLLLDSSPLFDISVDVDKDSRYFIFQLNLGKQFSTFSDKYTSLTTKRKCLEFSKSKLEFSIVHFNAINLNDMYTQYLECQRTETYKYEIVERALHALEMNEDYIDVLDYIPKVLDVYKKLPSPAVVRKSIITRQFEIRKVSEMEIYYPSIDWKKLLTNLVGKEVHDEDKVQVYFKDFFTELLGPKTTLNTKTLHEAILGMYAHDLYTNLILPTPTNNPEEFCLKYSSDLMKEVASSLFLDSIDPKNTNNPTDIEISGDLKRTEDLFSKMKNNLEDMINKASWIDHNTQNSMIRKLNNMEFNSWNRSTVWKNISLVEERMKNIETDYDNYTGFAATLVKRNRQLLYSMWDTMVYTEENVWWHFITPYSTSPKSIYHINSVFVPPGALLTKSVKVPKYLSLVKLGFKLAKAIARHFDYFGSSGLPGKPKQAYNESQTCILQSYEKINATEYDGKHLQVKISDESFMLSLNDRYAEDLAITLLTTMSSDDMKDYEISWFLDKPAFNPEKLFFIALGQEHCKKPRWEDFFVDFFESEHFSTPLLLDNSLSHSELFSEVFKCNDGSLMNPPLKCKPFPVIDEPEYDDYENED